MSEETKLTILWYGVNGGITIAIITLAYLFYRLMEKEGDK